jgi:hypothetical protein
METEKYVVIKDNKIIRKMHTSQGLTGIKTVLGDTQYDEIRKIPNVSFDVRTKRDVREYDENWKFHKLSKRVADGFVRIPENHKLDEETIRPMTVQERVDSGIIQIPPRMKVGNDHFVAMSDAEIVLSGQATQKELDDEKKAIQREQLIQQEMRKMAEESLIKKGEL